MADADEALTLSGYRDNIPLAQWFEQQAVIGRGERNDLVKAINEQQEEQKSQEQLQQQQNEELPNEQQRRQQQEKRQQKHFMAYRGALNGNAELLQALRLLSTARALPKKTSAFVEIESRRLDHLDSIAISEHNDRVHQLYFQGAADGLVAYHRGGFSKEDAAQIVRIAQAVGVGFLASGSTH